MFQLFQFDDASPSGNVYHHFIVASEKGLAKFMADYRQRNGDAFAPPLLVPVRMMSNDVQDVFQRAVDSVGACGWGFLIIGQIKTACWRADFQAWDRIRYRLANSAVPSDSMASLYAGSHVAGSLDDRCDDAGREDS